MQKNVGTIDRIVRIVLGGALVAVGVAGYLGAVTLAFGPVSQALAAVIVALVGAIILVTGLVQQCLIYRVFGISTYREPAAETPAGESVETTPEAEPPAGRPS